MKIKLRVVGMYFGASPGVGSNVSSDKFSGTKGEVEVEVPDGASVADVMRQASDDAAAGKIPNVAAFVVVPRDPQANEFLREILVVYTERPPMIEAPSKDLYVLKLTDSSGSPAHELQYYHYREKPVEGGGTDYVQLNKNNVTITTSEPPETPLQDGDSIVWRQVTILFAENGNPRDQMFAMGSAGKMTRKRGDKTMSAV